MWSETPREGGRSGGPSGGRRPARRDAEPTAETDGESEREQGRKRGRADDRGGDPANRLSVVAVTAFRAEEVVNSTVGMAAAAHIVSLDGDLNPLAKARAATRRTRRAIRTHDPDFLLLDSYGTVGAPAAAVASRYGVPVVARLVSDIWRRLDEERVSPAREARDVGGYLTARLNRGLTGFALDRASGFVVVSTEIREQVLRHTDCSPDRVAVVPVPVTVDTERQGSADRGRRSLGLSQDRVLLTVTNLGYEGKFVGTKHAVGELVPLLRDDPDLGYIVAGGGEFHGAFIDFLDETFPDPSVRERVHAPGYVDDVADLYALADVFVYVSHIDGYPNAVLEAQTAGLPVVANAAHGMCDQITDGETGVLVDGAAEGEVRSAVAALLSDDDRRRQLGEAARERVRRENSPQAVSRHLEAFLTRLCGPVSTGRRR
jgi:glycosyltransferase involved in cell wall biosynthesis